MQNNTRKQSQEDKILALFRSRGLMWTPAPELAGISLQYCRAVSALRKQGIAIENRVNVVDGKRHGFYRLAPARALTNLISRPAPPSNPALFGALPERHRDDA